MVLHPPKTREPIPGYVTQERIGVGGYGEVWSAHAPGGLTKAIKFVYGYFDDARAARELKALDRIKQVRHPFLLSLERFEVVDGQLIIVTELADMSLKDRFEQHRQSGAPGIPRDELLNYMRDAADALDYMSENFSLQHLDVKPENMLLVGGRVKVADFGLVKDLHDVTASMMGGLTPIYAAPEVFDDRPSQRSDQYSLAIVYQEMLTGNLPFPGRTPAQLASQHLHASPRLSSLPETDQPVIATALAKDPAQRFVSCRSMVDALLGQALRGASPELKPPGSVSTSDTKAIRSGISDTDARRPTELDGGQTQVLDAEVPPLSESRCAAMRRLQEAARPVADLEPLDLSDVSTDLRPTLLLGIGGTASHVLRHLRGRLRDRFGAASSLPAMPMLLLDTDAKSLYHATQGDRNTAIGDRETLGLPLRGAHDYTSDSRNILTWLSRRWLYNIPRSLQTEGRRPLGRLALVDHAPEVMGRLREMLKQMVADEVVAATSTATSHTIDAQAPRIVVVASISGGTGGGMVLDLAHAAGQLLAELGRPQASICTVLLHSSDRNPTAAELATANAYACLTELQHYQQEGYSLGAKSCGLPTPTDQAVRGPWYFVPLGHDLNDEQFDEAADRVAAYLYASLATKAAGALDKCRSADEETSDEVTLRGFGLASIGSLSTDLPAVAAESIAQGIVDCWRGAGQKRDSRIRGPAIDLAAARARLATGSDPIPTAAQHAESMALDLSRLRKSVAEILDKELGGDADAVFARLRSKVEAQGAHLGARTLRMLHAIRLLFEPPTVGEDGLKIPLPAHVVAIERGLKQLAAPQGETLRDWILSLVDHPQGRVGAAAEARAAYAAHLRELEAEATRILKDTQHNLQALEQSVQIADKAPAARTRMFGTRRAEEKRIAEIDGMLQLVVRLRIQELTLQGVGKVVKLLNASLSAAGDQIKDLQRELGLWADAFSAEWPWEEADDESAATVVDSVECQVASQLRSRLSELAVRVDEQVRSQFVQPHGGLRTVCQKADAMREGMLDALRSAARAEVLAALGTIAIDDAVLTADDDSQRALRLQSCVALARPQLVDCSGSQRLLAIVPESMSDGKLLSALTESLSPRPTLIADAGADLVLIYEQQGLSLPHVAARVIDGRKDFIEVGSRLHTRIDVEWTELPLPGHSLPAEAAAR